MKHVDTWKTRVSALELVAEMNRRGRDRRVKRQAFEDVSDELRLVVRRASAAGVPDSQCAAASEVTISTVRKWLGKGNDGQGNS